MIQFPSSCGTPGTKVPLQRFVLAATLLAAAALRLHGINAHGFWYDEAFTIHIVRSDWSGILHNIIVSENTPPLHYLLLKAWAGIAGITEWSMRLPSVAFGVISVWLMYRLTAYCIGVRSGLIAAIFLTTSRYHIYYSQEARVYALMLMLALWSFDEFVRLMSEPRTWQRELRYWVATAMLPFSHIYGAIPIGVQILCFLYRNVRKNSPPPISFRQFWMLQTAIWLPFGIWVPILFYWHRTRAAQFWIPRPTADEIANTYWHLTGWGNYSLIFLLCALAVLGAARRDLRRGWLMLLLGLLLIPVILPIIVSMITAPMFIPRYGIFAIIGLFSLAAAGIAVLPLFVRIVVTFSIALQLLLAPSPQYSEPWREAGAYLQEHMQAGDFLITDSPHGLITLEPYLHRQDIHRKGLYRVPLPLGLPLASESIHVWLVIGRPRVSPDGYPTIEAGHWRVCSQKRIDGVLIFELANGASDEANAYLDEVRFSAKPPTKDRTSPQRAPSTSPS